MRLFVLLAVLLCACRTAAPPWEEVWHVYFEPSVEIHAAVAMDILALTYGEFEVEFLLVDMEPEPSTEHSSICVYADPLGGPDIAGRAWVDNGDPNTDCNCGYAFMYALGVFVGALGDDPDPRQIGYVIAHEIGHSLGLRHVEGDPLNVMAPFLWPVASDPRTWNDLQVWWLSQLGGK